MSRDQIQKFHMPAEWEEHKATWIAWPHQEEDWPGKFEPIDAVYAEIVKALVVYGGEFVKIIVRPDDTSREERIEKLLSSYGITSGYEIYLMDTDRSWLRDSMPIFVNPVLDGLPDTNNNGLGHRHLLDFNFNGWAKYDNYLLDQKLPKFVSEITDLPLTVAKNLRGGNFILEGGGIDVDGEGNLLVTKECFLSDVQVRNPEMNKDEYEKLFAQYLGANNVIWIEGSCEGDDTHGHIDDAARFFAPGKVLLSFEEDSRDKINFDISQKNFEILKNHPAIKEVVKLPCPKPLFFDEQRLPASYANFYIANSAVLVPVFNDVNDRIALNIISECFPDRDIIPIFSSDLVLGLGTIHCLTQQEIA